MTTKTEVDGRVITYPDHVRFVEEARKAGHQPVIFRSRYGYCGPAIKGRDLERLQACVHVRTFWEKPGRFIVLYPARRDYTFEAKYPPAGRRHARV